MQHFDAASGGTSTRAVAVLRRVSRPSRQIIASGHRPNRIRVENAERRPPTGLFPLPKSSRHGQEHFNKNPAVSAGLRKELATTFLVGFLHHGFCIPPLVRPSFV
jgi:hypothetical protein